MANNCSLKFNETKVYTNLKAEVGNNDVLFNSLMSAVIDGSRPSGFNKEFETYYTINYGSVPNVNDESKEVATAIQNFYKNKNFNVNEHTTDSAFISDVKSKGYTSTAAKTCGIRTTGNLMLAFYHNDLIKGRLEEHAEDRKDNLANRVINRMLGAVAKNILEARKVEATKEEIAKVRKQLMNINDNDFVKIENEVSKSTPQLRNQFATLKDMLSDKVKYFTEVFQGDDRLGEIRFKKDDDLSQQEVNWNESYYIEDDEDYNINDAADNGSNSEKDTTTARWEDNGTKSDFTKDFSFAVRSYLSTIPKLSSTEVSADGKYQYDKSNPLGMVDYMDFKSVDNGIKGDIETTNIDAFLKKLEDVAESNKEYAGLAYLANDLRKKPDFAYKVFQVYRRRTMRKQQARIDDNTVVPVRSNIRADKLETLRINYLNDIKSTALNIMIEDTNEILRVINEKIKAYKKIPADSRFDLNRQALSADIINAIASRLKQYYPSLDKAAIERFARLNGKVDGKTVNIGNNLTQLYGYLENTAKYANETLSNKQYLDNRFKEANKIKDKKAKKEALDSVREAYKQGYLSTNTKAYALELAKDLAPYSVVNIDSNSTNALGNQSADQINDSMITNFLNAVKATLTEQQKDGTKVSTELVNYGKYKFQGVQYNLSGILMEHSNENGAIINYGLFYKDKDGNIQITNYARDMINISLFDGAGNPNTKDNVLYSGMSKGDYVYTGFAQYFNAEQNPKMLMGDYFMRIPSDAPKNFVVHAPRYKVDGLFSKMHAIRNAKGEVIAKEVNAEDINENHPIVQQFRNIFKQELLDMANFINIVFETNSLGQIKYNDDGSPMFKKGWGLDAESARRVFANYHIGKGHKHFIEKKGDGWAFNGLLFKDDRFVLTDYKTGKTTKYGDRLLKYLFPSLYGGARDGFIPFTTNANGEVELNLNADQEATITRMVKGFVTDYSNNAITRMSEYKDLDINNLINEKNSIDFALNHRLMYIAFNDVFEGDTKFYKDTQTFLKRSKESQASGVPYGFVDTSLDLRENSAIVQGAFLNTPEVQARLKSIGLDVQQKTKFNGITIKNTVRTSEECKVAKTYPDGKVEGEDGILVKDLVKNAKLTLEQARDLIGGPIMYDNNSKPKLNDDGSYKRSGGFSNTTINDAQSYITFEEWIRRIAGRGQLNDYLPLIEAIQDESKEIPADLLKKFVQVQKNFYYDQYYDEKLNTIAPRQIKNAEFVLVPRFIRGTQLEQVYNAMKANGIDQLNTEETSKAGKARVLTIFDEKTGEVTEEHLKDFNNKAKDYREEYDYNHLYTQQETPQHMNANNKAGIQIMKKILDNIDSKSPLYKYKEDFFNMYVANIKDSFNSLVDELKIPLDKDGNIKFDESGNITGIDMQVFFDKLKDECMRLGLDSNMMDFVTLNANMPIAANGCPNPVMPTYLSNVINKLESISQAMFNSAITRQELPGFHAAQITNVGFNSKKYTKENPFNLDGIDKTKFDVEVYDREKTPGYKSKALRIYIKGKKKGWFELVKDKEDNNYSVHFKTTTEKIGKVEQDGKTVNPSTKEERDELYTALRNAIPNGANVSTWGSISDGGVYALNKLGKGWKKVGERTIKHKKDDKDIVIPVYQKNGLTTSKTLRYHPKTKEHPEGERYIEIMLPASNFGFAKNADGTYKKSKEELLKELQAADLDTLIGYRIPTEGKQSVCVMKVVGFLDDAQGSTIVVPDDWVSQTGSDFDIDSVYGIQYNTYIGRDGNIKRATWKDTVTENDWLNYIRRETGLKLSGIDNEKFENIKADAKASTKAEARDARKAEIAEIKNKFDEIESEAYFNLDDDTKEVIKLIHEKINEAYGTKPSKAKYQEQLEVEISTLTKRLEDFKDTYIEEELDAIKDYIEAKKQILNNVINGFELSDDFDYNAIKSEKIKSAIKAYKDEQLRLAKQIAKSSRLLQFEAYKKKFDSDVVGNNTRAARNNRLLDDMIHILRANESLEENLSRSNFESIIAARDKVMNPIVKEVREDRSPYDFFDQAAYQEDVMSGVKLKAFSVTRDTFCSVCNTVRPHIADNYIVKIAYSKDKYNLEELQKRFEKVEETDEGYVVTHNTLGWTNDNKNVDGYILTAYSSQTTAHILDAVKEGAIPNVNDFTFAVYKTLADIGSNYDTAVGFIMQPAITRIVNAYNANKSIYSDKHNKPIEEAIASLGKEILNAYHIKTDKMNLGEIVDRVNALLGVKYSLDKHNDITLSPDELAKRLLNDENRPVKGSVYQHDWAVLFAYNDLAKLSDKIGSTARVCNPDRFGAKQSIFATRKVFNDIADLIEDENPALVVGTSSIVNSIYAGYDPNKGLRSYITSDAKSAYPSLNAFLKYASAPSILVNRMLFDTEQDNFRIANRAIEVINGSNNVTEKDYKGFTQYILNTAYKQTDAVVCNYTYDVEKKQTVVNKEIDETDEALRIMGYGCTPDFTFNVKDVNNPTQKEVDAWSKLSPAQKISWLKANSVDAGIFNYINTNLFNEYEMNRDGQSRQTIRFNEDAVDNETAYNLFDTVFNSNNPLVKLAAMDMVKYAFVAEGFKIGRGAINKCIKNTALRDENTFVQYNGSRTSIIAQIKTQINNAIARTDLIEQYLRTDPGVTNVPHKFMNKKYSSMFKTVTRGMYEFSLDDKNNAIEFGFARESNSKVVPIQFNDYIYITKKEGNESITRLYKIVSPAPGIGFAYPLNSLEAGEDREISINNANNSVPLPSYYETVIDNLMSDEPDYTLDELNKLYQENIARTKINKVNIAAHFDIMEDAKKDNGGAKDAINKIIKAFNNTTASKVFIQNMYLHSNSDYRRFTAPIHIEGETTDDSGNKININGDFIFRQATKSNVALHNKLTKDDVEFKPQMVEVSMMPSMASSREEITLGSASSKLEQSLRTTTDSFEKNIVKELNRRSGLGDIEAGKLMRQLRGEGFEQSTKAYKEFKDSVFYSGYAYLKHKVNNTLGKFSQFYRNEDGNYFAINSPEVIEAIKNNPALQRQFLETLADANAIIDKFGIINQIKADEIENPTLKFYIEEMQKMIKELSNSSVIDDAEVKFGIDYLQKLSNDPNIQNGLVSIFDGFHSSGWFDAWVGDLQEQGNSLVQVVTRKVMADIRAKENQAKDFAIAFGKHFEDIKARAAKVGASVDLNKIFDKNGNIVRNYTDKFVEDIKELKRNVAKARVNVQENPMEYIQAKHKLDKFLLDHVNREYVDSYYQKLYDEDEFIINNHPQIYSEYVKLQEAIRQINSRRIDGVLSKEFEDKLVELRTKINDLTSQFIGNEYKPDFREGFPGTEKAPDESIIITNQEVYDNARKQSLNDAVQLDQHLRRIKDIKEEYTAKEEKEGFRDMLDKMLNIIDNAEVRDSNGKVTTPASQLETNKEYKKAKEWIANNAHWSVDDILKVQIEDAYKKLGITSSKNSKARKLIKEKLTKGEQIYDEFGNIDASKFTNIEIAAIKEDIERNYGTSNTSLFSDRNLINSAEPTNEAAPSEFFKMLNSGGRSNPEYQEIVTKINNITRKYYNSAAKIVETSKMSIEDLKALADLYDELDKTKKKIGGPYGYDAYQAYSKYAKVNENTKAYYDEEGEAKKRTEPEFYTLWKRVNTRYEVLRDKKGKIIVDETTGKAVYDLTKAAKPNPWLYASISPNDAYWEDLNKDNPKEAARQKKEIEDKTKAQEFLSNTLETINTPQYYKAKNAALAKGIAYYKEWYDNNHVYNPFTHAYEALPIWNRTRVIPSIDNGEYSPNWTQTTLTPKAHYKNPNYIEGYTDNENYKTVETDDKNGTTHVPGYDNNLGLNEYEQEAKQYIQDTLMQFAKTETAKRAIASGMAPHRVKKAEHDAKWAAKQAKEFIGFSDMLPSGKDSWYEKIDYSEDRTIDMPMLMVQLKNKESVDLDNIRSTKPKRETYTSDEAYEKDLEAYQKRIDEATKKNEEIHQKLLDRDYIGAIQDFISAAGHYNAIQDNKQLLFYTHRMLGKMKAYDTNLGWNNLRKDSQTSTSDETSYIEKADTRLQEQFDNWVRRLVYNQYKIPQNKLTKTASMLQSFTSAKFMMLNITGAIGNITIGESAIAGEYIAKEYFTPTGWLKGKNMWRQAVPSFIRGMANEDSTTLADALVKFMNIVDFDEVNNRPTVHLDADTVLNKIRDFMYSPNSMGEHFMQNGAMFSMFFDNRMVKVPDAESNGRLGYEAMTWEQYKNKFHEYAMKNIIGGNEELLNKYETFKKNILVDDNKKKEYIWNRRDINTEFANLYLTKEQKKQFITERKKLEKEAKVKFEELPTVMDQVDLKDGRLAFKEGSILAELQAKSQDKEVGDGYMFLGYMKGKVISTNKKIHGVYDKLGAAQLEKQWWGSLAMQYHKHIYPGVMKHYRRKGYFNEERGTKEVGCAPALFDFLTTPIRQLRYEKEMSDGQVETLESLQVLLKGYAEFAMNLQTNWQLMPKWQRASIERAAGDVVGALSGVCTALAVRCIWDDDDLKNSLWGNLMLYEADDLTTQSMMYNMLFLPQQFDQLWSSPIAGVTAGKDIMAACNNIAAYVMDDDYDPNYTSGRYAGQNKILVKLGRQIPIYRSLNNLATLDKANSYYKTGDNLLTLIDVKDWANDIRGTSSLER